MSNDSRLRAIGEVAAMLGVKTHVLRYWEDHFPQIKPLKRAGGRRYYRDDDVALLVRINQLIHHEGYTMKGALSHLSGGDALADRHTTAVTSRNSDAELVAGLRRIRADLAKALEQA